MAIDPLTAGLVTAGVSTLANGFMQQRAAAYNQEQVSKNTAMNYKYAMRAQQNAPVNEVYGLKAAGLSPTFANGAQGMAVSQGSAGTAQAPSVDPANLLMFAQLKNVEAQTQKVKAEAKSTQLQNAIVEGQNMSLGQNLKRYFAKFADETSDPELKEFFKEQSDFAGSSEFTSGNYDALIKYFDLQGKSEEAIGRKLDRKLSAWLSELRWNKASGKTLDDPFVKALGTLDARQSDLIAEQLSNAIATGKQIDKETQLTGAKLTLTNEQIEQVKAAAAQLKDTNVMEFINEGDYGRALLAMLLQVFSGVAGRGASYVGQ